MTQTAVFTLRLVEQSPTAANFRGIAISEISAVNIPNKNILERLREGLNVKTPREIDMEDAIGRREITSLRGQVMLLAALFVAAMILAVMLITALNTRFPLQRYIYTSNAAAVCTFAPLGERGDVTDAAVLNFATMTAVDVHTFDYINWRKTLDTVTIARFTPEARASATTGLRDSGVLTSVVEKSFVLKAVLSGPAVIREQGVVGSHYVWRVEVPLTLAYTGGINADKSMAYRPENRTIVLTVRRAEFTADNPDGLLVSAMSSIQTMTEGDADANPGQADQ